MISMISMCVCVCVCVCVLCVCVCVCVCAYTFYGRAISKCRLHMCTLPYPHKYCKHAHGYII